MTWILFAGIVLLVGLCLRVIQKKDALEVENLRLRTDLLETHLQCQHLENQLQSHKDALEEVAQERDQARALAKLTNYDVTSP